MYGVSDMFYKPKTQKAAAEKQNIAVIFIQMWDEARRINCVFWSLGEHHLLPSLSLIVIKWVEYPNLDVLETIQILNT